MKFLYYTLAFVPVLILLLIYAFRLIMRLTKPLMKLEKKKLWKAVRIALSLIICAMSFMVFSVPGIISLHFLVLALITDIVMWLVNKVCKLKKESKWNSSWRYLLPAIATIAFIFYGYWNLNHLVVTEYELDSQKIDGNGYRIAFLSDVHYGGIQKKQVLKEKIDEINAKNPDLIILGGDITEEETSNEEMHEIFEILSGLKSKYGTYYVYGNHDLQLYRDKEQRSYSWNEYLEALHKAGITVLDDEAVIIDKDFLLIGRKDLSMGERLSLKDLEAFGRAFELGGGIKPDYFILEIDHQPNLEEGKSDLLLSGHTHGGQMWPIGIIMDILGDPTYGEYTKKKHLIVSSGVAGWGFPFKTAKRSEYLIIDVK
ncbi:MAG: metallophosphoesterase family protein [Lachnospiraceae bacterium]|nr:metallophosphoesterase family protein [Lachnospiraceae bacterium]